MITENKGHVVEVVDFSARHFDDAITPGDSRTVRRPPRPHRRQQHASIGTRHRRVIGNAAEKCSKAPAVSGHRGCAGRGLIGQRFCPVNQLAEDVAEKLRDASAAGDVQPVDVVVGGVVIGMGPGKEMNHGDAVCVEGHLVGWAIPVAPRKQIESALLCEWCEDRLPVRRRICTHRVELFFAQSSHHVEVDHGHGFFHWEDGVAHIPPRAQKSGFFAAKSHDDQAAPRFLLPRAVVLDVLH